MITLRRSEQRNGVNKVVTDASIGSAVEVGAGVDLFAIRVRNSGFSVGYHVCLPAFGGTTPYVVAYIGPNVPIRRVTVRKCRRKTVQRRGPS